MAENPTTVGELSEDEEDFEVFFDYAYDDGCQYPVYASYKPDHEDACGEPAIARVWWEGWAKDGKEPEWRTGWRVCQEHFDLIRKQEEGR